MLSLLLLSRDGLAGMVAARDDFPKPTEEEAQQLFAPNKIFSLSCMYAQLAVDVYLCGIYTMQLFTYWKWARKDPVWTRLVVVATSGMAYVMTSYIVWFMSYLFVINFGLYAPFLQTTKLAWFPLLDSIASGFVQGFFTYRAFRLNNRSWWIVVVNTVLIASSFGAGLATKLMFSKLNSELEAPKVRVPMLVWLASCMACDLLITVAVLWGLYKTKTGWTHTDKLITRLIRINFESQLPPTLLAIAFMAEFIATPSSLLGSTFQGIQSKFYCIGLLYSLNSRVRFAPKSVTIDGNAAVGGAGGGMGTSADRNGIQVDVQTEIYETFDMIDRSRNPRSVNRDYGHVSNLSQIAEQLGDAEKGFPNDNGNGHDGHMVYADPTGNGGTNSKTGSSAKVNILEAPTETASYGNSSLAGTDKAMIEHVEHAEDK